MLGQVGHRHAAPPPLPPLAATDVPLVEHWHHWQGLPPPEIQGTVSVSAKLARHHQEALASVRQGEGGEGEEPRPGLVQQLLEHGGHVVVEHGGALHVAVLPVALHHRLHLQNRFV